MPSLETVQSTFVETTNSVIAKPRLSVRQRYIVLLESYWYALPSLLSTIGHGAQARAAREGRTPEAQVQTQTHARRQGDGSKIGIAARRPFRAYVAQPRSRNKGRGDERGASATSELSAHVLVDVIGKRTSYAGVGSLGPLGSVLMMMNQCILAATGYRYTSHDTARCYPNEPQGKGERERERKQSVYKGCRGVESVLGLHMWLERLSRRANKLSERSGCVRGSVWVYI